MELTDRMSERPRAGIFGSIRAGAPSEGDGEGEAEAPASDGSLIQPRSGTFNFDQRVFRGALIATLVVAAVSIAAVLIWELRVLLLFVLFSIFAAAMLHPIVNWVQRLGLRRKSARVFSRAIATTVVFFGSVVVIGGLLALLIGPVVNSASHFVHELPQIVRQAQHGKGQVGHLVMRLHLLRFVQTRQANLQSIVSKLSKPALAVGKTVVSGVVALVTVFFLTFFILLDAPHLVRGVLGSMRPERAERARAVMDDVGSAVVGFVLANMLTSVIAGAVVGFALYLVGVPFWQVLALWVAFVDFLPLIGGLLAGVPVVLLALLHSVPAGIIVFIVFVVYQQIENHLLNPTIMSRTVKLNPLGVLLAVLIGAQLGSIIGSVLGALLGALVAVPTACAIQVIFRDLWHHRDENRPEEAEQAG
jgi:predicted PurR-regulated permease PerM